MHVNRILPITLGLAMIAVASVQAYAFMVASTEVAAPAGQLDMVKLVEDLRADVADEDLACETKLANIDGALAEIDAMLDSGVQDERSLLVARQAIAQLRLSVPCTTGTQLTAADPAVITDNIVSERLVDLGPVSQVGYQFGGGGGGGPLTKLGGSNDNDSNVGRLLLFGGVAAAITIPIATSSSDAPGTPATP